MSNILLFRPKRHKDSRRQQIISLVPKDKSEGYKADIAEKTLEAKDYIYYLAYIISYNAYNYVSKQHKERIRELTNIGVLDEVAYTSKSGLTDSCVQYNNFVYKGKSYELPGNYVARIRFLIDYDIYVEAFNKLGDCRLYKFIYEDGTHKWEQIDENDYLVDF
ncbi:MAG TPA: hypothetical protein GX747_03455 [Tenericutes bacterium]|mgnify:CR=1 FL=1|nr:hypothetical protein [Mycoplasmatota bacterium]